MIVKESISFERGIDPKEAIFGIRPGTLVTTDRRWNGTSIMIEVFLRIPNLEDLRRWDPKKEHNRDKYLTYEVGLLQDLIEDAYGKGKDKPPTFFPHGFSGFNFQLESENLRKLTEKENKIVLRGLTEPRNLKSVQEIYDGVEKLAGVKIIIPVNESLNFERGLNPKESMKIGPLTFNNLEEGSIIKSKRGFSISKRNQEISPQYTISDERKFEKGEKFVIMWITDRTRDMDITFRDKEDKRYTAWALRNKWEDYFDVVQRSEIEPEKGKKESALNNI